MGENGDMGEKNNGILEKTSPNSSFIIHHSSFPLSPFFQTAKLLRSFYFVMAPKERQAYESYADDLHQPRLNLSNSAFVEAQP